MFNKFFTILFAFFYFIPMIAQQEKLMNLIHTPGDLNVEIYNDGSIGHDNETKDRGRGVTWKGTDGCYVGGPIFGIISTMSVNGDLGSFSIVDIQSVSSNFLGGDELPLGNDGQATGVRYGVAYEVDAV